jgi:hypothetical protein
VIVMRGLVASTSCTLLVASLAATAAMPSIQEPTSRAGTRLVEVSAIVSRDGQPVTDLQASEVEVLDNGVPSQSSPSSM